MSEEEPSVLETIEEETREMEEEKPVRKPTRDLPTRSVGKNPNRVKAGHKLAAIGQKAKEDKMRRKVEDEMIKPKTWVSIGVIIGAICVGGLWLGIPLVGGNKKEETPIPVEAKKSPPKYFG